MRATRPSARVAFAALLLVLGAGVEAQARLRLRHHVAPPPPLLDEPFAFPGVPSSEIPYPEQSGPYPSGFAITVDVADGRRAAGPIDKPIEAARALAACWTPPFAPAQATARFQFNRAGAIIGAPRIAYLDAGARAASSDRTDLARSILAAFTSCVPLRFTPGFAAAIAGYPFALRFVARDPNPPPQPRDR